MRIFQHSILSSEMLAEMNIGFDPDVIFLFVSPQFRKTEKIVGALKVQYPETVIVGCSTAGEIMGDQVLDGSIALTAVKFRATRVSLAETFVSHHKDSLSTGHHLYEQLRAEDLKHILVFSDGLLVNGANLVKGLNQGADTTVSITGGLAGDGVDFGSTFVISNEGIASGKIVALGLYGDALKVGYGSKGGWDSFGVERLVTRSKDNVLYELDGFPALELYKSFLGDKAEELPSSGLLFPLSLRDEEHQIPVVRTILSIDEKAQSLTFAGNIPEGAYVRLMKANVDHLINGAEQSARIGALQEAQGDQLAFLISCVGRRLVLKQLVEEEVEAVNGILGKNTFTTGFYSYGEIAPFDQFSPCTLHNQTMTITTFTE